MLCAAPPVEPRWIDSLISAARVWGMEVIPAARASSASPTARRLCKVAVLSGGSKQFESMRPAVVPGCLVAASGPSPRGRGARMDILSRWVPDGTRVVMVTSALIDRGPMASEKPGDLVGWLE